MKNFIIACVLMFSTLTVSQMSFSINSIDINSPMDTEANLGWFMSDDILVSFGMSDWDNFNLGARYYTGFCGNMFIEANTTAVSSLNDEGNSDYIIGANIGWTKSLSLWWA